MKTTPFPGRLVTSAFRVMEPRRELTFTIEPLINAGKAGIRELADGWTIVTKDHSLSAQWEHTVAVTESGVEVLTSSAGALPAPALPPAGR